MDFGLVTVMTRLRTGQFWKRGSISEWGAGFFSSSPPDHLWGPTSLLFDEYLGLLKSTTKIRRALSYSLILAVMHEHGASLTCVQRIEVAC
jgi:hypothetical protein